MSLKLKEIKVGDTFYVCLGPYMISKYVCTSLITFEGRDHFMVEHNYGSIRNDVCYKSRNKVINAAKKYKLRELKIAKEQAISAQQRVEQLERHLDEIYIRGEDE